jgi:hypothetical protein
MRAYFREHAETCSAQANAASTRTLDTRAVQKFSCEGFKFLHHLPPFADGTATPKKAELAAL